MTVILVTQETGARGDEVAAGIAASLGFELVHLEGVEQRVAERMQVNTPVLDRLLDGNASLVERLMSGSSQLMCCMAEELARLGAQSNVVIRGGRATALLRPIKHVICVHACAPVGPQLPAPGGYRGGRVPYRRFRQNAARLRRWLFAKPGEGSQSYDLVLNTAQIPVDECVDRVLRLLQSPQFQPTTVSRAMFTDHRLTTCNDTLLTSGSSAERAAPALEVDVCGDTIRLSPAVSSEEAIARVEQHLRGKKDRAALAARASSRATQQGLF